MNTLCPGPTELMSVGALADEKYSAWNVCVALLNTQMLLTLKFVARAATAAPFDPAARLAGVISSLQPVDSGAVIGPGVMFTVVEAVAAAPVKSPTKVATTVAVPAEPPPISVAVTLWQEVSVSAGIRPRVGMRMVGAVAGMAPQCTAITCAAPRPGFTTVGPAGVAPAAANTPRLVVNSTLPDSAPGTRAIVPSGTIGLPMPRLHSSVEVKPVTAEMGMQGVAEAW